MQHRVIGVAAAALAVACSSGSGDSEGSSSVPGGIWLVVETDMAVPEELDEIEVEIKSGGITQFLQGVSVGPGGTDLPATLGISTVLEGNGLESGTIPPGVLVVPGGDVVARVWASRAGQAVTYRRIDVDLPPRGIKELRVPVEASCVGQVLDDAFDPQSTCPAGQSCAGGACADDAVNVEALPDKR